MKLENQNILFLARTMKPGGTENVILQLCEIFKPLVHNIIVCSCGGVNVKKLHDMGIRHYNIGDPEDKHPWNILKNCKVINDIVNSEQITVVHTHHRMAAFYVSLMGLYKKCILINTSHNTFTNRKMLTRYAYLHVNLVACGEMVKNNLTDVYGLSNIRVIHNAVKPFLENVVMDARLQTDRSKGKILIGNIGRLSEQKGMEYFINAVPLVLEKHPNARFYIIGSGEDEEKLQKMSRDLPVVFLGYRADVQNIMTQLDFVVLSSLWEGFPLTPMEAFSVGKTIIATGVDGTLEIVKDKENGLLVKPGDAKGLAEKICWIIEHPTEKAQMEKKAKEAFEKEFSYKKFARSYIDYYGSL